MIFSNIDQDVRFNPKLGFNLDQNLRFLGVDDNLDDSIDTQNEVKNQIPTQTIVIGVSSMVFTLIILAVVLIIMWYVFREVSQNF